MHKVIIWIYPLYGSIHFDMYIYNYIYTWLCHNMDIPYMYSHPTEFSHPTHLCQLITIQHICRGVDMKLHQTRICFHTLHYYTHPAYFSHPTHLCQLNNIQHICRGVDTQFRQPFHTHTPLHIYMHRQILVAFPALLRSTQVCRV